METLKKEYILLAVDAAMAAGKKIMEVYEDPNADFEVERKADNSPLTIADRKAHEVIATMLAETPFPLLSEEGKHLPYVQRAGWKQLWIVDPLDGTKEFIKKNGEFTVNIALVENGVPMLGVIYLPVKQTLYWGCYGMGAFRLTGISERGMFTLEELEAQADRLPQERVHGADTLVVVASRSHLSPETEAYINDLRKQYKQVECVSSGSSIKICRVAEGSADVYPRFAPTMEWDTAAGHAIVRAAGKEMVCADRPDVPLTYNKEDLLNPWFIVR